MTTAIENQIATLPQRAAVALKSTEQESALRALVLSSADIVAVVNKDGREQAHRIGMTLKTARVSIEKTSKAAREDATAFSKAVINEERRLIDIVSAEETRVFGLRDNYDAIEAKRVGDAIAAERARTDLIKERIEDLRRIPLGVIGSSAAAIQTELNDTVAIVITEDRFGEQAYRDQAESVRGEVVAKLESILADATAKEAESARLVAERAAEDQRRADEAAELARQRAEQQGVAAEQAAAQKALEDAAAAQREALRIEAEKVAAARQAEDDERARVAAEAADVLAEQQAAFAAERQAFADQQAAVAQERVAAEVKAQFEAQQAALAAERAAAPATHLQQAMAELNATSVPTDPDFAEVAPAVPPSLSLGKIGAKLGFNVTADFLLSLGFAPAATVKASKLFHEAQFPAICAAIIRHISAVSAAN